ncbi:MAG TPA: hypothetical protein VN380_21265 [Thermoanaerobaculia bacterium]|jgi:hypothetical protein|nr:hypothetical protein [Thermoanaerobaculia bacterium]
MREYWRKINNANAHQLWSKKTEELFGAIEFCLKSNFWEPALILIYAGIDSMAWLNLPEGKHDVTATEFIQWCNRYLLLPEDAELRAEDLYAARCGLLHSYTAESRRYREKKVTKLFYSRETTAGEINLDQLGGEEHTWPLWTDVDILFGRLRSAVHRFQEDIATDSNRANSVYARIRRSYLVEVKVKDLSSSEHDQGE